MVAIAFHLITDLLPMTAQFSGPSIPQISVEEFAHHLADRSSQPPIQLIDVREPGELMLAHLEGFQNFPLSEFAEWSEQIHQRLDATAETIVMCHHGMRSAQMCYWLMNQGFINVKNLQGGIDAYACRVDSSIPRY